MSLLLSQTGAAPPAVVPRLRTLLRVGLVFAAAILQSGVT